MQFALYERELRIVSTDIIIFAMWKGIY